ncbi:MAG: lipocalin family protein [Chlorobi bacterium]|nr:lipocalin family protein [Chlorobiota bacterium]
MRLFGKTGKTGVPLPTVEHVDVARYCGTWYEIAAIVRKRQRGCTHTKAEYTLTSEGRVRVGNSCRRNGKTVSVSAVASPVEGSGNAWLKVKFFGLFSANYRVIELASDYSWAVVANTSGSGVWVLGRTPYMSGEVYEAVVAKLRQRGIDVTRLQKTPQ